MSNINFKQIKLRALFFFINSNNETLVVVVKYAKSINSRTIHYYLLM